ncbi:EF-hand domain-containing protein [Sphingomonas jaspsi]|uniref:EF-hand domain-containing protein n=1 Tax=Sphingomonas jaspsi TaxID=392409 RepID=UPI0004B135F5|nr:EF-hand domain-containing protein [Sphingomonas jaspsi]
MLRPITALTLLFASTAALAQAAPEADQPKPVAKAELTAELDADYADLDANHDGKADDAEIKARLIRTAKAQLDEMAAQRDAAFARVDTDGNGSISKAEFNAQAKLPAMPEANSKPFLDEFDKNKDGAISKDEFRAPTLSNFDRLDANKDGTLSVAEQQAASRPKAQQSPSIGR